MQLYGSLTSPYVRKIRILVHEKRLPVEFIAEGPSDSAGNIARLNPLGKVPVLVRENGEVLFDSPVIMEYLDHLTEPTLIPPVGEERWQALRWHALAQGLMDATVTRLMETRRPPAQQSQETVAKQERKIHNALQFAAARLPSSEFLVGKTLTIADIAMGTALGYVNFRYSSGWESEHTELSHWVAGMQARPSFLATTAPAGS